MNIHISCKQAKLLMLSALTVCLYPELACAQTTVQPDAPLAILQSARSKVQSSSLNMQTIQEKASNFSIIVVVVCALLGIGCAGVSLYKLWQAVSHPEQGARNGGILAPITGVVVAGMLAIVSIVVAYTQNVFN